MGYYVEGLTQVELAVLLGTSPGAIKTHGCTRPETLRAVLLPLKWDKTNYSPFWQKGIFELGEFGSSH